MGWLLGEATRGSNHEPAMPSVCLSGHVDEEDIGHLEQVQAQDLPQKIREKQDLCSGDLGGELFKRLVNQGIVPLGV